MQNQTDSVWSVSEHSDFTSAAPLSFEKHLKYRNSFVKQLLFMFFIEHTGGSWDYFHQQIKHILNSVEYLWQQDVVCQNESE